MRALTIRQPWAWLILHAGKDIENRTWATSFRGPFLVHAAKGMTRAEYDRANAFARQTGRLGVELPPPEALARGGVVGAVTLVDCVPQSASPWYMGQMGFVLQRPVVLPFVPCRGQLGFFDIADAVLEEAGIDVTHLKGMGNG